MKIFAICIGLVFGIFAIAIYAFGAKLRLKAPCVRIVVTSDRPGRRWGSPPGGFPIGGGQISLREIHFGGGGG